VGYVGEVSLGHAALFGIGSYTAGVLHFQLGAPFLLAVPASILVTGLFGCCARTAGIAGERTLSGDGDLGLLAPSFRF